LEAEFTQGASRLDVFNPITKTIYDFKFYKNGTAPMSRATLEKYIYEFKPSAIKTVNPKTGVSVKY
jgi:hypothetical protein